MHVATPTPAQAEAGNYRKGHTRWNGLDFTIETPKGGTRTAVDGSWKVENLPTHYGYIRGTEGADGEQVDMHLGDEPDSPMVWVIDQVDHKTKKFDEHKVMAGFKKRTDALDAYHRSFSDGKGKERVGGITPMPVPHFVRWVQKGITDRPLVKPWEKES